MVMDFGKQGVGLFSSEEHQQSDHHDCVEPLRDFVSTNVRQNPSDRKIFIRSSFLNPFHCGACVNRQHVRAAPRNHDIQVSHAASRSSTRPCTNGRAAFSKGLSAKSL